MDNTASVLQVVLVINPGSTSTKFGLWRRDGCHVEHTVRHDPGDLAPRAIDQWEVRRKLVDRALEPHLNEVNIIGAVGRGGLLKPVAGGTYRVNSAMLEELRRPETPNHASNLGALLADHYARQFQVPAFVVDPVTVDEFHDLARVSGVPWIERRSRSHALNIKAVSRKAAERLGVALPQARFVVAHLGGGISVAAVDGCQIVDVNDALLGMGPFSPERAGALPIGPLVERCFSGQVTRQELLDELSRCSGLSAYCGTSDVRVILERIRGGDQAADLALRAMIYQIAKEIGAYAAALEGRLNAVILTGGLAHSSEIVDMLTPYVNFLGKILVFPGEGEMEALAAGAFRVLDGEEPARDYPG